MSFLFSVRNILAKLPDEEIKASVNSPEVIHSLARREPKLGTSLSELKNDFSIRIDTDLEIARMEGVLALWEDQDGMIESKLLTSGNGTTFEPSQVS